VAQAANRNTAIGGLFWTALGSGATAASQFALYFVLAHYLRPHEMGLAAISLVVTNIVLAWSDVGLSSAIIRETELTIDQLSTLYWSTLIAGAILCAVQYCASGPIAGMLGDARMEPLIKLGAAAFPIASVGAPYQALLQKQLRFRKLSVVECSASIAGAAVGICAAVFGYGAASLIYGMLFAYFSKSIGLLAVGLSYWHPRLVLRGSGLGPLVRFGAFQLGDRTLQSANFYVDQIVTSSLLGAQSAGYYSFGSNLATTPVFRINAIANRAALPLLCKAWKDRQLVKRGYLELLRLVSLINFPLLLALAALAPTFVPLLFGQAWTPSVTIVQILALASVARAISNPVSVLLLAWGRADIGFIWNLSISAYCLLLTWAGATVAGVVGVATAQMAASFTLGAVLYFTLVRRVLGACGREYFAAFLPALIAAAIMAVSEAVAQSEMPSDSSVQIRLAVALALGIVYLIAIWFLAPKCRQDLVHVVTWFRNRHHDAQKRS